MKRVLVTGVSIKQVIHAMTERLGEQELVHFGALQTPLGDPASLVANTTRLKNELVWKPQFALGEELEDTIA